MQRQFSGAGETFRVRRSHLYVFASGFSKRTGRGRFRGFASTVFRSGVHPYTIPASKVIFRRSHGNDSTTSKTPPKKTTAFEPATFRRSHGDASGSEAKLKLSDKSKVES